MGWPTDRDTELFGMIESGRLQVEISNRYALKDAAAAQDALSARQTGQARDLESLAGRSPDQVCRQSKRPW